LLHEENENVRKHEKMEEKFISLWEG
jgi:hypothetical protein